MKPISFIDIEVEPKTRKILDLGCFKHDGSSIHSKSIREFTDFLHGSTFLCGHNILNHDLVHLQDALQAAGITTQQVIDTLFLSPLLIMRVFIK